MTVHKSCGKEIRWATRDDDPERFNPPLEFDGHRYIITEDGTAVYTSTYVHHECDPADIIRWQRLKHDQAKAMGIQPEEVSDSTLAREEERKERWKVALKEPCPTCDVPVGHKCHNLTARKKGRRELTKNPHPARLEFVWREEMMNATP